MAIDILKTKAILLSGATIKISPDAVFSPSLTPDSSIYTDNHHGNPWIFFKISTNTRVRLTVDNKYGRFRLLKSDIDTTTFKIIDDGSDQIIVDNVKIEKALVHCPRQLFLGLYEYCSAGCLFCPISGQERPICYSLNDIMSDIDKHGNEEVDAIGITTGVPPGMSFEEVGKELAGVVRQIRRRVGPTLPIGVSTKHPSRDVIYQLRNAGADEIRLNLELYNYDLASKIMPNKSIDDILSSIEEACQIFGRGKVSSNLIAGIGESDDDIISGVTILAKLGAVATIYPYDPVPGRGEILSHATGASIGTPSADRLVELAVHHKDILATNSLLPDMHTMCPSCAASHIMPGKDL